MTHITSLHFKNVNFLSFPRSSVGMPTPALQRRLTDRRSGQDSYHAGAWEPEKQDRGSEAEALYRQAASIAEKSLSSANPILAAALDGQAGLYGKQGRSAEAEASYKRALSMSEQMLGAEHPYIAKSLNNLGGLYLDQQRFAEAEPLLLRALAMQEKMLGADHPALAATLDNLAKVHAKQGRMKESDALFKLAIDIQERSLGPQNPRVAETLYNQGEYYFQLRLYSDCEENFQRALSIRKAAFGDHPHPDVARSLSSLGILYAAQGQYAKAEPLLAQAVSIFEVVFKPEHREVIKSREDLEKLRQAKSR
ncbi:MAG: tetratricopeptide repeat protein [Candidatus Methylumidiphilus sp.]